jgi:hypothetical protein
VARLRVGDVEISGSNIQIGPTGAAPDALHPATPPAHGLRWLSRIPLSPAALAVTGVATSVIGTVWALATHGPLGVDTYLTRGFFLIPLGIALCIAGALKRYASETGTVFALQRADALTEASIDRVRALLVQPDATHTIEWIAHTLAWPPDDVVRTLGWLKAREELVEDVDATSGQFFYVAVSQPTDLDARLRHL